MVSSCERDERGVLCGADGRAAIRPRARRFKLRRESEQRSFFTEAPNEMSAYRQSFAAPEQRHRHRRLTRRIADRRERNKLRSLPHASHRILGCRVEAAKRQRRFSKRRRKPDVVILHKASEVTSRSLQPLEREQISRTCLLAAHLIQRPRSRFEPLGACFLLCVKSH